MRSNGGRVLTAVHNFFHWEPSTAFFAALDVIAPDEPQEKARLLWSLCDWWFRVHTAVAVIAAGVGSGLFAMVPYAFAELNRPQEATDADIAGWTALVALGLSGGALLWWLCALSLARAGGVRDRYQRYTQKLS